MTITSYYVHYYNEERQYRATSFFQTIERRGKADMKAALRFHLEDTGMGRGLPYIQVHEGKNGPLVVNLQKEGEEQDGRVVYRDRITGGVYLWGLSQRQMNINLYQEGFHG